MAQGYVAPQINVWPGKITQIIDPHYFWMHFGTNELLQQFEILQRGIQLFCKQNWTCVVDSEQLEPGQVVLIDTGIQDGTQFRRGQVTRLTSTNSVDVFYVDYGLTELKTTDCICVNFPPNFKKWPPQAVRCSLAGVLPISKNWTSRATKTFQKITEGKLFKTLVLYGQPGFCEVSLYPSDSDNGRSVSHLFLDEDLALPDEGKEVPEYFSEIVEFLSAYMPPEMVSQLDSRGENKTLETPQTSAVPSANVPSKPIDRYVPPQRKNMDFSLKTSFAADDSTQFNNRSGKSNLSESVPGNTGNYMSPKSHTAQKQSPKGLHLNTNLDKNKPVNDFFPFENVSTYPPTPTSPMKSPVKATSTSAVGENSYFSRLISKPDNIESSTNAQQHYTPTGRVEVGSFNGHREHAHNRQHDHRFAANLNNLPSPGRSDPNKSPVSHIGTSLLDGQNAAANLEPKYLNSAIPDRQDRLYGAPHSPKSPPNNQSPTGQHYGMDYRSPAGDKGRVSNHVPFYPPSSQYGDMAAKMDQNMSQTPPQNHSVLVPPGFYASSPRQLHDNQSEAYRSSQTGYSNDSYSYGHNTSYRSPKKDLPDQYYHYGSQHGNHGNQYSRPGSYHSPPKYTKSREQYDFSDSERNPGRYIDSSSSPTVPNTNNSSYNNQSRPQLKVRLPETPSKTTTIEKRGKMSPHSPDSADIGDFNIGDIDHTQYTSADYFHQRVHQEKLIALQEEAEDIAAESKEQSKLVEMARYGASTEDHEDVVIEEESSDIFQQIAEEITSASTTHSKEFEELKRSPIKRNKSSEDGSYVSQKIDSIPTAYVADIDFAEAIKEALEFSQNDGLENVKFLLDGIVEAMKSANVEKQLYDVLMLLLAKAIKDYNSFHRLILDVVNILNVEMEIKECLVKALKRQQELCIRLPVPKNSKHLNCSRIMGHLFVLSHDWTDSNSTIQDALLVTVEKWILFNSKGSQIGQTEKEILFLDCFGAFWEVAGPKLIDHNYGFRTRIQKEIKAKLLNENVSRSVRERLLDILLELFSHCVETASVHTQTTHRTMIPSSCQVKPAVASKGIMTKPVQFDDGDDDYMLEEYSRKWQFLSSNDVTDDMNFSHRSDSTQDIGDQHDIPAVKNDSMADMSFHSANADISVYDTPNTSIDLESDSYVNRSIDKDSALVSKETLSVSKESVQSAGASTAWNISEKSFSSVTKSGNAKTSPKKQTVSATKSATGRSIVDWFDYEPQSEEMEIKTKSESIRIEAKVPISDNALGKLEKESTEKSKPDTEDSIEKKYTEVGQRNNKSAKSKKNRKNKKSSPNKESLTNSPDKESESVAVQERAASNIDSEKRVTMSSSNDNLTTNEYIEATSNMEVDWWGKEESGNMMDNIYVDTGPDVVIEEDIELCDSDINDHISHSGPTGDGLGVTMKKELNSDMVELKLNDIYSDVNESGANNKHRTDISVERLMDEGIQKMNDEYAFDTDSDEDEFLGDMGATLNYDADFPESDLRTEVRTSFSSSSKFVSDDSYDRDFPRSNLHEYLPPFQEMDQPSPPKTQWVPRKRICLNCHDDNHTTDQCPKGFLLLQ